MIAMSTSLVHSNSDSKLNRGFGEYEKQELHNRKITCGDRIRALSVAVIVVAIAATIWHLAYLIMHASPDIYVQVLNLGRIKQENYIWFFRAARQPLNNQNLLPRPAKGNSFLK